jgi:ribosomal protein L20A (L18A)
MKQVFEIEGDFQMGRIRQHFVLQMVGATEDDAREAIYTELGSRHSVKRRQVKINSLKVVEGDAVDGIAAAKL